MPANFERNLKRHGLAMRLPDSRQIINVRAGDTAMALAYNNGRRL